MYLFAYRVCDRHGQILSEESWRHATLVEALRLGNSRAMALIHGSGHDKVDREGRIEIADADGNPLARIPLSEIER